MPTPVSIDSNFLIAGLVIWILLQVIQSVTNIWTSLKRNPSLDKEMASFASQAYVDARLGEAAALIKSEAENRKEEIDKLWQAHNGYRRSAEQIFSDIQRTLGNLEGTLNVVKEQLKSRNT